MGACCDQPRGQAPPSRGGVELPARSREVSSQPVGTANYVDSLMDHNDQFFCLALGRFISANMIVPGAGNNQAYSRCICVLVNPIWLRDPSGHFTCAIRRIRGEIINRVVAFVNGFPNGRPKIRPSLPSLSLR